MQTIDYKTAFICPKCGEELEIGERRMFCQNRHSYDKSRAGYYNLLLSGGGTHGDNLDMVLARRAFLSGGAYSRFAERISALTLEYTSPGDRVLDAGCGEGYYTDLVERALTLRDGESDVYAFDISKDAVQRTAKKNPRIHTAVAGSYHMPIADGSISAVINTFSPMAEDEVRRVLSEGGKFILAVPDENHLFELKSLIYDNPYKNTLRDSDLPGFRLVFDERLTYSISLGSPEEVKTLFMMTPYAYRTRAEDKAKIDTVSSLSVTADFHIYVYERL